MQARMGIGVIGLGRRWQRYRVALARLRHQLQVRAVCDQVGRRAEREARQLGCAAAGGPVDLLDRDDVEAVLLLDRQWFGLWPLEYACRQGKPVFCAAPLTGEGAFADRLQALVRASGARVMMALAACAAPSFRRLSELLPQHLGPARFVRVDAFVRTRTAVPPGELLRSSVAVSLFQVCRALMGDAPHQVVVQLPAATSFASTVFAFGTGRVAQVNLAAGAAERPGWRIEVRGEKGTALTSGPRALRWSDAAGHHTHRLARTSLGQSMLEEFLRALRANEPPRPSFDDAYQGLLWQRAALGGRPDPGGIV
jgi:predicted dehydrogenase